MASFTRIGSGLLVLVALVSLQAVCLAARPLSENPGSRILLQSQACPAPMSQCFTTPYQAQYFCCDSSQNLMCSGGADFQCTNFISGGLFPASLVPDIGLGPKKAAPTQPTAVAAEVFVPQPTAASTQAPQNPAPTNPPQNPAPTDPPQIVAALSNPPQNPAPTDPPPVVLPAATNPPQNPAPTDPPQPVVAAPVNPAADVGPASSSGWTNGIATFFGGPGAFNGGNCGFGGNVPNNGYVVALPNHLYYNGGCGTCLEVKCVAPSTLPFIIGGISDGNACLTDKPIIVYASDRCPECDDARGDCTLRGFCPAPGGYDSDPSFGSHIDLGMPAWQLIGKINAGIITVAYRQVACPSFDQLGFQN